MYYIVIVAGLISQDSKAMLSHYFLLSKPPRQFLGCGYLRWRGGKIEHNKGRRSIDTTSFPLASVVTAGGRPSPNKPTNNGVGQCIN